MDGAEILEVVYGMSMYWTAMKIEGRGWPRDRRARGRLYQEGLVYRPCEESIRKAS